MEPSPFSHPLLRKKINNKFPLLKILSKMPKFTIHNETPILTWCKSNGENSAKRRVLTKDTNFEFWKNYLLKKFKTKK